MTQDPVLAVLQANAKAGKRSLAEQIADRLFHDLAAYF